MTTMKTCYQEPTRDIYFPSQKESRINKSVILIIKIGCFGLVLQSGPRHDVILGPS